MIVTVNGIRCIEDQAEDVFAIDLIANGEARSYTVIMDPDCNSMEVAEDQESDFGQLFRRDIMIPGKLAGLVGKVRQGEAVTFPVEVDNSPHEIA